MIKFDSDIPHPQPKQSWKQFRVFHDMTVKHSFFVAHEIPAVAQNIILKRFREFYKDTNIKIKTSRRVENGVKGVRVWRIQ